jgi:hypothetical protein
METKIYFDKKGNSILGNYSFYVRLSAMLKTKGVNEPFGYTVTIRDDVDERSLYNYIELFASPLKLLSTLRAWRKACGYAEVQFTKTIC